MQRDILFQLGGMMSWVIIPSKLPLDQISNAFTQGGIFISKNGTLPQMSLIHNGLRSLSRYVLCAYMHELHHCCYFELRLGYTLDIKRSYDYIFILWFF